MAGSPDRGLIALEGGMPPRPGMGSPRAEDEAARITS
jgi:hypothetical protein